MRDRSRAAILSAMVLIVSLPAGAVGHAPEAWLSRVTEDLRRSEYRFSPQADGSLSAPNRAHNLRSAFGTDGLLVVPRTVTHEEPSWWLGLSVAGYGREGATERTAALHVASHENRVELHHTHLTEFGSPGATHLKPEVRH